MTREGKRRLKYIDEIENNETKYKYLNKVLKWQSRKKLKEFLILADNRYIDKKTLVHEGKYPYFTAPINNLIREYGGSKGTWNRNINLFVVLGFVGKVDTSEVFKHNHLFYEYTMLGKIEVTRKFGISHSCVKDQNVYYVFSYNEKILQEAENRAKVMYENGFSMKSFSKIYLQRVFGLDFANNVYFNDIEESEYTQAVAEKIEKVILEMIKRKHFTFKDEIVNEVAKSIDTTIYKHYEENYFKGKTTSTEKIAGFEYGRSIKMICANNELGYTMSNKYMKRIFNLKNNKKLIYNKKYFEKQKEKLEVTDAYFNKQCKNKRK